MKNNTIDWDQYLIDLDTDLYSKGYRKYKQNYKNEDFCYWKTFNNKQYQVGLLLYDFRKYMDRDPIGCNRIGIQYQCMILEFDNRMDLSVSDDKISLEKFEEISKDFYICMKKYGNGN